MVDRYSITQDPHQLISQKGTWEPLFNAYPTQKLPVMLTPNEISFFHWGLMAKWSNNKVMSSKLFNLDVKRALEKTSFRKSLQSRRCVALADGYYLWRQIGKKQHTPYYHYLPNQQLFGIAGIWESSEDMDGKTIECFMCLTQDQGLVGTVPEEHPVVIESQDLSTWLSDGPGDNEIEQMIEKSRSLEFEAHPVSPAIKNVLNNGKSLITPAMPADQHGNYTLF